MKPLPPLIAIGAALLGAGCGSTVVDQEAAEQDIRVGFGERNVTVNEVDCPADVETESGASYECVATTSKGRFRVIYRQLDGEGKVSAPRLERLTERPGGG